MFYWFWGANPSPLLLLLRGGEFSPRRSNGALDNLGEEYGHGMPPMELLRRVMPPKT